MKKSDYLRERTKKWIDAGWDGSSMYVIPSAAQRALADVEAAEAAGKVWDPEEEPLPERVTTHGGHLVVGVGLTGGFRRLTIREVDEAVRRWNAWSELRVIVNGWGIVGSPFDDLTGSCKAQILAVLDGNGTNEAGS